MRPPRNEAAIFSLCRLEPFSPISCLTCSPPLLLSSCPVHPRRRGGKRQRERIRTPFSVAAVRRRPVPLSPFHLADLCVMLDHSTASQRASQKKELLGDGSPSSTTVGGCCFPMPITRVFLPKMTYHLLAGGRCTWRLGAGRGHPNHSCIQKSPLRRAVFEDHSWPSQLFACHLHPVVLIEV